MNSVDIIIVNWNAGDLLRRCLASLAAAGGRSLKGATVVDNASADDSLSDLTLGSLPLTIVRNAVNVGFGAACNQAARASSAEYLLFLNPDTRASGTAIDACAAFLDGHARAAVCGLALEGEDGQVQRSSCRAPTAWSMVVKALGLDRLTRGLVRSYPMSEWDHAESRRVDHVIGAFYMIRRSVFEELSGFDERYFVYLEDVDLSVRVRSAGWETWFLAGPRVWHKGGGTSEQVKATRLFYSLRSRLQYASKHFRVLGAAAVWVATLLLELPIRLAVAAGHGSANQFAETVSAFGRLWRWAIAGRRRT